MHTILHSMGASRAATPIRVAAVGTLALIALNAFAYVPQWVPTTFHPELTSYHVHVADFTGDRRPDVVRRHDQRLLALSSSNATAR